MDGVQLSQGLSHFKEAVYFLPLISQKLLVFTLFTSEGWKAESTLEQPSGLKMGPLDWESNALTFPTKKDVPIFDEGNSSNNGNSLSICSTFSSISEKENKEILMTVQKIKIKKQRIR